MRLLGRVRSWRAGPLLALGLSLGFPDFDVVEETVFTGAAELDFGFGGVGDSGGFEVADGFSIDAHAHFFANCFDGERVPRFFFEFHGETGGSSDEEFVGFGFSGGVHAHFADIVSHGAVALVDEGDAVEADLSATDVAIVGAFVLAVVELDIEHSGAFEPDPDFDDAIFCWDFEAVHGGMRLGGGLAVGGGFVFVPGLRAFEHSIFEGEGGHDLVPRRVAGGFGKIVREKQTPLFRERLCGNIGGERGKREQGCNEQGEGGVVGTHFGRVGWREDLSEGGHSCPPQ